MLTPLEVLLLYPAHDGTLASMLSGRASVAPEKEFLSYQGTTFTYREAQE